MFCAIELSEPFTDNKITIWSNLVFGTQDTMTVPFPFRMTKYVFFPDEYDSVKSSLIEEILPSKCWKSTDTE